MFSLVVSRYERASLIVTSNKPFSAWGEIFGDEVVAAAMIDRLVHHAEILSLKGDSYRLRDRDPAADHPPASPKPRRQLVTPAARRPAERLTTPRSKPVTAEVDAEPPDQAFTPSPTASRKPPESSWGHSDRDPFSTGARRVRFRPALTRAGGDGGRPVPSGLGSVRYLRVRPLVREQRAVATSPCAYRLE
jgi:hypothetical protein